MKAWIIVFILHFFETRAIREKSFVICAQSPREDSGGGQRSAQVLHFYLNHYCAKKINLNKSNQNLLKINRNSFYIYIRVEFKYIKISIESIHFLCPPPLILNSSPRHLFFLDIQYYMFPFCPI